jgi:hypothetical protein
MKRVRDAVFRKQIDLLYMQSNIAVLTGMGTAVFVWLFYWPVADQQVLFSWIGAIFLLSLARLVLFQRFQKVRLKDFHTAIWLRRHLVTTFFSGLTWGLLSLIYEPNWPLAQQVVLFVVLTGLAAGSTLAYATVPEVFVAFLVPLLLPMDIGLFFHGDTATTALGGFVFLFAV